MLREREEIFWIKNQIFKNNFLFSLANSGGLDSLTELSKKIEHATAPILRPSKLIKVGQPQPALLLLASVLDEKAKCIERLPVLEGELRHCHAAQTGDLLKTEIGGDSTSKAFNQVYFRFIDDIREITLISDN